MRKYKEETSESSATRAARLVEKLEETRKDVEDSTIGGKSLDEAILEQLSKAKAGEGRDHDNADEDISKEALDFILRSRGSEVDSSSNPVELLEPTLSGDTHDLQSDE